MIDRYLRLRHKNKNPSVTLAETPVGPFDIARTLVKIEFTQYSVDPDTGEVVSSVVTLQEDLEQFVTGGLLARKRWQAYREIYESLTGETFPN